MLAFPFSLRPRPPSDELGRISLYDLTVGELPDCTADYMSTMVENRLWSDTKIKGYRYRIGELNFTVRKDAVSV